MLSVKQGGIKYHFFKNLARSPGGAVANMIDCDIKVNQPKFLVRLDLWLNSGLPYLMKTTVANFTLYIYIYIIWKQIVCM